jgi:hypothetical protein
MSSDGKLKDGIISAWTITTSVINVFNSNEDIAKIVEILIAFASLAPTAEEAGIKPNLFETRSWTTMGWALNSEWNGKFCLPLHDMLCLLTLGTGFIADPKLYKNESAYSKAITRFLIANKFVASLARANIARYNLFIIWTMRPALEYSPDQREKRDDPEIYVPAAAACIMIAGKKIRGYDDLFPPGELTGRPAKGGPLWEGKHGFCEGRWRLWKERFLSIAQEPGISEQTKTVARDAHDEIERIDQDM